MEADYLGVSFEIGTRRGDFAPHSPPPPPCAAPAWPKPPKDTLRARKTMNQKIPKIQSAPNIPTSFRFRHVRRSFPSFDRMDPSGLEPSGGAQFSRR